MVRWGLGGSVGLLLLACSGSAAQPARPAPEQARGPESRTFERFFFAGDGEIALQNAHTGEVVRVRFREADGSYSKPALARIDRLLRSRADGATTSMSLRLIEAIDHFEDEAKPSKILVHSGYRSPTYNDAIIARGGGAAKASMHTEGLAVDATFRGVDARKLWDRIRALECCGVGFYQKSGFLHLDAGQPRFWEETTSRVSEDLSADNARVFARTEYDRYGSDETVQVRLHSVTLLPLRIEPRAELVADHADPAAATLATVALVPEQGAEQEKDGCLTIRGRGKISPALRVPALNMTVARGRLRLRTCAPRLGKTPPTIETNPIEIAARGS
jgi:uncharacterized protein YcbK (DUF882 family)